MPSREPVHLLSQPDIGARSPRASYAGIIGHNVDLILIFLLMVSNIRILKGNPVSSFMVLELFAWVYCAPYVVSSVVLRAKFLSASSRGFIFKVWIYGIWLIVTSIIALVMRGSSEVLQSAKNVLPGVILAPYFLLRLRNMKQIVLISNLYIVYGVSSAVLGLLQAHFGGPYFADLNIGIDYKQDLLGDVVSNPIVGFSTHPNEFAVSVLPAAGWAAMKLFGRMRSANRIDVGALAIASLIIITMIIAQAKGASAFTVVAIAFFASPLGRSRSFVLKLAYVSLFITGIVYFGLSETASGGAPGAETVETRFLLWQTAFRGFAADWYIALFGDGRGYMGQWSEIFAGWEFPNAHNAWIDQIVQFGAPALLLYLAIWWSFFRATEAPISARLPLNAVLMDGCRVTVLALMGDYFFEPASNDVSYFAELILIMTMGLTIAKLSPGNRVALRPEAGAFEEIGPLVRQGPGVGR